MRRECSASGSGVLLGDGVALLQDGAALPRHTRAHHQPQQGLRDRTGGPGEVLPPPSTHVAPALQRHPHKRPSASRSVNCPAATTARARRAMIEQRRPDRPPSGSREQGLVVRFRCSRYTSRSRRALVDRPSRDRLFLSSAAVSFGSKTSRSCPRKGARTPNGHTEVMQELGVRVVADALLVGASTTLILGVQHRPDRVGRGHGGGERGPAWAGSSCPHWVQVQRLESPAPKRESGLGLEPPCSRHTIRIPRERPSCNRVPDGPPRTE